MVEKTTKKIRVLVGKPGLDGHDRGAKVVARSLRDAGFEVIYTGLHQTPQSIARVAVEEDVDVVGLSVLSGAHMSLVPRVVEKLREAGKEDALLIVGGIIPEDDRPKLLQMGVDKVFGPGTPTGEIIEFIRESTGRKRGKGDSAA